MHIIIWYLLAGRSVLEKKHPARGLGHSPRGHTQDQGNKCSFPKMDWPRPTNTVTCLFLCWILIKGIQFKIKWSMCVLDNSGKKGDTVCWMFAFYIVLWHKKKLENVGNLQVAHTQDLDGKIQITGTRMISQSDSKIGSQTAEKVEKKRKKFTTCTMQWNEIYHWTAGPLCQY